MILEKKFSPFWVWENEIPPQICNHIIKQSNENDTWESGVAGKGTKEDQEHRKNDIQWWGNETPTSRWCNGILFSYILKANAFNFDYEMSLDDKESMQVCRYGENEFYEVHIDCCYNRDSNQFTRKLSASLQLSNENDYEGGGLELYLIGAPFAEKDKEVYKVKKSQGTIVVFDSRTEHRVLPVTSGIRYSAQKWAHGDRPLR